MAVCSSLTFNLCSVILFSSRYEVPSQNYIDAMPKTSVSIIIVATPLCEEVLAKVNALFFDGKTSEGFDRQVK